MKRKMTALLLILFAALHPLCANPHGARTQESRSEQQPEQRSGSETSFQTVSSEQLEEIYALIDDMRDQWISDITLHEEKIFSLKKQRRFWIKVSVCEALVIAAGAYCIHNFNK